MIKYCFLKFIYYDSEEIGSYLSYFRNPAFIKNLEVLFHNDKKLFNQYGAILVNPQKCPNTNIEDSKVFLDWLLSKEGQNTIKKYKVNGVQLFYPNAN